jgi:predicted SAM-dependent methyltransferase
MGRNLTTSNNQQHAVGQKHAAVDATVVGTLTELTQTRLMRMDQAKPTIETPTGRNLHIGGSAAHADWEVFNAIAGGHVDHVGNANDLSRFADNTFSQVYASHVAEHLDYTAELSLTLNEWKRVLVPGGTILLSVPDLDVLATLILDKERLTLEERFLVMRMIFGGHTDPFDYHYTGLNEEFLTEFLQGAGFTSITRVESLGCFNDTSEMEFVGTRISLNMTARKPATP